jgi:hypothetical protein
MARTAAASSTLQTTAVHSVMREMVGSAVSGHGSGTSGTSISSSWTHATSTSSSTISYADSDDYSFNRIQSCNSAISASRLESAEWDLSREIHLPAHIPTSSSTQADVAAPTPEDLRRMQVIALTRPNCFPFTVAHAIVFAQAHAYQERMHMWLRWRGYLAILLVPVLCGITPMLPLSNLSHVPRRCFGSNSLRP